jgi:hypothetical protein
MKKLFIILILLSFFKNQTNETKLVVNANLNKELSNSNNNIVVFGKNKDTGKWFRGNLNNKQISFGYKKKGNKYFNDVHQLKIFFFDKITNYKKVSEVFSFDNPHFKFEIITNNKTNKNKYKSIKL